MITPLVLDLGKAIRNMMLIASPVMMDASVDGNGDPVEEEGSKQLWRIRRGL